MKNYTEKFEQIIGAIKNDTTALKSAAKAMDTITEYFTLKTRAKIGTIDASQTISVDVAISSFNELNQFCEKHNLPLFHEEPLDETTIDTACREVVQDVFANRHKY